MCYVGIERTPKKKQINTKPNYWKVIAIKHAKSYIAMLHDSKKKNACYQNEKGIKEMK